MPTPVVRRPAGLAEAGASAAAIVLTLSLAWHGLGVYFCLGAPCPRPSDPQILTYRLLAAALGLAVLTSLALAARRRATLAFLWHLPVALAAAAVAIVFAVPQIDVRDVAESDPPAENPYYEPCYSGSGDCPGG